MFSVNCVVFGPDESVIVYLSMACLAINYTLFFIFLPILMLASNYQSVKAVITSDRPSLRIMIDCRLTDPWSDGKSPRSDKLSVGIGTIRR